MAHDVAMDDLAIRRGDLRHVLRLGTVRWWKDDKGYGRIAADDGEVLFVHFSAIVTAETYRALEEGQRVCFVWRGGEVAHGRHSAEEVRVIGQRQPASEEEAVDFDSSAGDR
jgi:cold shock CspA family protein